ncbi:MULTISPECIES: hypothetical protein [Microvirga]|uniref:hypothetical protein n=1 Tax=Microvirga TaxID=186650 RepID=UPI0021C99EF5|nr:MULTISPECIES: hypothetical protein [unclassified Microvirga]
MRLKPLVGIFWGVRWSGAIVLIFDKTDLDAAEPYGEFLTHPKGHYEFWEELRKEGVGPLKRRGWPAMLLSYEYEQWPRGRIVYNTKTNFFTLYADRKLQSGAIIQRIISEFGLASENCAVQSDPHYRSTETL